MKLPDAILNSPTRTGETLFAELKRLLAPETVLRRDEPLAKRTTLRVGGPAEIFVEPASDADLAAVVKFCAERAVNFFVLGRGSNLLVRDGGVRGVVISLAHPHFSRVDVDGERIGMDLHELGGGAYPEFVIHRDESYR